MRNLEQRCGSQRLFSRIAALRRLLGSRRGQAAVEMALLLPVVFFALIVGVQFALIGEAALALGQADYQGARYAAVHTSASAADITNYILQVASPTISAKSGKYLTVNVNPTTTRNFTDPVTVSVTFDVAHLVVLPNPFLGIRFPTQLTNTETAMSE